MNRRAVESMRESPFAPFGSTGLFRQASRMKMLRSLRADAMASTTAKRRDRASLDVLQALQTRAPTGRR